MEVDATTAVEWLRRQRSLVVPWLPSTFLRSRDLEVFLGPFTPREVLLGERAFPHLLNSGPGSGERMATISSLPAAWREQARRGSLDPRRV